MLPSFDELMKLAKRDPAKLETLRQSWVEDVISSAPDHFQRRLRGLQFQIDMERQKASNPVSSCIRISQMMHEGLANLRDALNQQPELESAPSHEPTSIATIIPFP
jgi:hypothetical protein